MNCGSKLVILILGASLISQTGCGTGASSSSSEAEQSPQHVELREVGEMYRIFINDNKRPAHAVKDLLKYAVAFDFGAMAMQEKRILVLWDVDLKPESNEVLAYQKGVPESGGLVLLRDGETVKQMTAEEFRSATAGSAKRPG